MKKSFISTTIVTTCILLISCSSSKDLRRKFEKKKGLFFTKNLANIKNNNNTASYGSVVSYSSAVNYPISYNYFPSLGQNFRQKYLIIHYTVLDNKKSIEALTSENVSSHYLILRDENDKHIYQLVDENKRAYHAGLSKWGKDSSINDTSIGIEIVNPGFVSKNDQMIFNTPYSESQFTKVAVLMKDIISRYNIPPTNILAHSDIAPGRKQDPGAHFPWKRLYDEYNIGMWYSEEAYNYNFNLLSDSFSDKFNTPEFIENVQNSFEKFGYAINITKEWDDQTKRVIQAFQFHFRPKSYSGILDQETFAILLSLNSKYRNK